MLLYSTSQFGLAAFWDPNSHMWVMATILDSTDLKCHRFDIMIFLIFGKLYLNLNVRTADSVSSNLLQPNMYAQLKQKQIWPNNENLVALLQKATIYLCVLHYLLGTADICRKRGVDGEQNVSKIFDQKWWGLFDGFSNKLSTQSTWEHLVQHPSLNRNRDPEKSVFSSR